MDSILKYAQKAQKAYEHYGKTEVEVKVLEVKVLVGRGLTVAIRVVMQAVRKAVK